MRLTEYLLFMTLFTFCLKANTLLEPLADEKKFIDILKEEKKLIDRLVQRELRIVDLVQVEKTFLDLVSDDKKVLELVKDEKKIADLVTSEDKPPDPVKVKAKKSNKNLLDHVGHLVKIIKDTKWCGLGNRATKDELGILSELDKCCREHDKCPINIQPLNMKYGTLRLAPSTISHCNCDDKFYDCLKSLQAAGDPDAHWVGDLYFNHFKMPCLEKDPIGNYKKKTRSESF